MPGRGAHVTFPKGSRTTWSLGRAFAGEQPSAALPGRLGSQIPFELVVLVVVVVVVELFWVGVSVARRTRSCKS